MTLRLALWLLLQIRTLDVFPRGLYIESAMAIAKEELKRECDYVIEAENQRRYKALIGDSPYFVVPGLCSAVLCGGKKLRALTHSVRNFHPLYVLFQTLFLSCPRPPSSPRRLWKECLWIRYGFPLTHLYF